MHVVKDDATSYNAKEQELVWKNWGLENARFNWPANLPDLNQIETCWSYMKLNSKAGMHKEQLKEIWAS